MIKILLIWAYALHMQCNLDLAVWLVFKWALMRENLSSGFANNKVLYQPVHPHSLIGPIIIC